MTKMKLLGAIAVLAIAGCSKKSGSGGGGGGGGGDMPDALAAWMPADADKAWQGAWQGHLTVTTKMSMGSDPAAVEIKDGKATVFDGSAETTLGFAVHAPCAASFKLDKDGATYTFTKHFVLVGGKLAAGDGPVGMRKGKTAIVCGSQLTTLDDKGTCLEWSDFMDKWQSKPATCAWSQKDGKDILTIGTGDFATTVIADGDTLMTEQFKDESKTAFTQATDYAAAKAWVATQKK